MMSSNMLGMLIGGLLPAVCFALCSFFNKVSVNNGVSPGIYTVVAGGAVVCLGLVINIFDSERSITWPGAAAAFASGASWGIAVGGISFAVLFFSTPISKLVPIHAFSAIVALVLGLWLLSEWKEVAVAKLVVGCLFVVLGTYLVAHS